MSLLTSSRVRNRLGVPAAVLVGLVLLAGCSGGSASGAASTGAAAQGGAAAPGGGQGGAGMAGGGGGVSGTIAAIQGSVLQVQGTDTQTAVTYAADTVITQTVSAALAQVTVGSCIVAASGGAGGAAAGTATTSSTTTASTTATTVRTSAAVDGACTSGFGGGRMPSGMPTDLPSGMPTDLPSGMPTDLPSGAAMPGGFGQRTSGLVTAVSGTTITVQATGLDAAVTTETVEVGPDTTYSASVPADAAAIAVGLCASAQGTTDSSGTMAATTLTLSQPTAGSCTQANGMGGGMGRAPGGNAASNG